ncbi:galactitol-specific PTS system EIIC component [Escherichia coli]|nr:galactitol-specific PTS system EIIC component [Escherichia coli]
MDGLTPIAKQARSRLQAKFGGQEFLIGLDPALLLGHTAVVSASLIFIPLTILIAVCVPGNQVLPFGDLATIGFFVAMAVAVHRGNLFRTLISGVIIMSITLWIATQTIGLHTQLAANAGRVKSRGYGGFNGSGRFSHYLVTDSGFLPAKIFPASLLSAQFILPVFS